MTDPVLETKSPLALKFERLQKANADLTEMERELSRLQQRIGQQQNEVFYAQRDYNTELGRSRSVDAMRRA